MQYSFIFPILRAVLISYAVDVGRPRLNIRKNQLMGKLKISDVLTIFSTAAIETRPLEIV